MIRVRAGERGHHAYAAAGLRRSFQRQAELGAERLPRRRAEKRVCDCASLFVGPVRQASPKSVIGDSLVACVGPRLWHAVGAFDYEEAVDHAVSAHLVRA